MGRSKARRLTPIASAPGAFTSELIRLRGQGRGSAHNEALQRHCLPIARREYNVISTGSKCSPAKFGCLSPTHWAP
jgi:hypothetical protein